MTVNLSNLIIAAIRTNVPLGVGVLLTWAASSLHIVVDPNTQTGLAALCVVVLTSLYWTLARLLEAKFPLAGLLLGVPAQPVYRRRESAAGRMKRLGAAKG